MVEWCLDKLPPARSPTVLEIGSGNGVLLTALVEKGYDPNLIQGIDYSHGAVQLAKKVASTRGELFSQITFNTCDFLHEKVPTLRQQNTTFDLVLDKGTFDAIALAEKHPDGSSPCDLYLRQLFPALSSGGYFLITCNSLVTSRCDGLTYHLC
jgi:cyclopropane fatty-acyl-phospholipid synthase-like methyltransferase